MPGAISIYVTCANGDEAKLIARHLLDKRLVACANILANVTSLYHWQGEIAEDVEVALIAKARATDFDNAAEVIRAHHSYDTPAIMAWPITAMDEATRAWLLAETKKGEA
ncbi:MAG: divalent-cation tolerance protein CutA [Alphaproteobacteria bacterium]